MNQINLYNEDILQKNYENIWEKNKEILLKGGHGDPYLNSEGIDTRMALSLLIRIKGEVSDKIEDYIKELKSVDPSLYYYPPEDFHITVLDILRGEPGRKVPENIDNYISCIQKCANQVTPFQIHFKGTTASDNCILVCGYYEFGLEQLRESIRKALFDQNLILEERYKTFSSHITVARIPDKISNPDIFLPHLKKEIDFGTMKVTSLDLTFHNWYDSQKKSMANIKLGK